MKTFTLSRAIDNIKECNKSTQKRPLSFHQISSTHSAVVFQAGKKDFLIVIDFPPQYSYSFTMGEVPTDVNETSKQQPSFDILPSPART